MNRIDAFLAVVVEESIQMIRDLFYISGKVFTGEVFAVIYI